MRNRISGGLEWLADEWVDVAILLLLAAGTLAAIFYNTAPGPITGFWS